MNILEEKLNYNFVIFIQNAELLKISLSELNKRADVKLFSTFLPNNKLLQVVFRLHFSNKINKILKLPFKKIWFIRYGNLIFNQTRPLCFLINAEIMGGDGMDGFISYLKDRYPNSRYVAFYTDLVRTRNINEQPSQLSRMFDLITTYDESEACEYNLKYHPTCFGNIEVADNPTINECDVYFVGAAKNRWNSIFNSYLKLTEIGLSCDFYITQLPKKKQIDKKGLHYIDRLNYLENLQHVIKTKFLLEIEQEGATGPTFRTWEAIYFNKALLTNNKSIVNSVFYNNRFVSIIKDDFSFDMDFILNYKPYENRNPLIDEINPINYIKYIDKQLVDLK